MKIDEKPNENRRRVFWKEQMEAAYEMMNEILDYPVEECGEKLVSLHEAAQAATVDIEFSSTLLSNKYKRIFYLREGLIQDVIEIAGQMNQKGWVLKIEDAYRTREMQTSLAHSADIFDRILSRVMWETNGEIPSPEFVFRRITAVIATYPKIGTHMSGSAIDISVLHAADRSELDRGGIYISEMSELTPMASPFVSAQAKQHRNEITAIMKRCGFMPYPYEFWHYSKGDAYAEYLQHTGKPARYGAIDRDPVTGSIQPIDRPESPLHSPEEIRLEIEQALQRLRAE